MTTFVDGIIFGDATTSLSTWSFMPSVTDVVTDSIDTTLNGRRSTTCPQCAITTVASTAVDETTTGLLDIDPISLSALSSPGMDFWNDTGRGLLNTTSEEPSPEQDDMTQKLLVGILATLLAIAITFGNTLVILAVYRERNLRTITNFFIVSLACADFLIGTVVLPFSIHMEVTQGYWPFGAVWCDLWHAFDILGCTASILNLCMIACDRYWAITHPFSYPTRMTKRNAAILIGAAWICSALISFPCIVWWRGVEPPHLPNQCIFPSNTVYLITSSCVSFYLPSTIMVFLYLKIYRTAVGQVRAIRTGTKRVKTVNGNGIAMRVHKGGGMRNGDVTLQKRTSVEIDSISPRTVQGAANRRNSLPGKKFMSRLSREHKAARTLGIVMGVFVICWLPFFIVNVTAPVCQSCYFHPIVIGTVTWLGYVNSALNPIIYAFASRRFKRAFTRILCAWKGAMKKQKWSDQENGAISMSHKHGKYPETSLTQFSEEKSSVESNRGTQPNLKYTLPYIYF